MSRICTVLFFFCALLASVALSCAAPRAGISNLGFAIQVGAFADVNNAERLTAKLQQKGIEAFYFKKETGIYAVRFGDFESRDAARRTAKKLVQDRIITTYFIAPPRTEGGEVRQVVVQKPPAPSLKNLPPPPSLEKKVVPEPRRDRNSDMGSIAARTAERFVGIPYRWGGNNVVEGMDCSGFVRAVFNLCGVNIPRTSREQFSVGDPVGKGELKEGDLVFFGDSAEAINHVGIFVGNGRFVHAPRRGDDIKLSTIEEGYYLKRFVGAKRYF